MATARDALLERDLERNQLERLVERLSTGFGTTVVIEGPAGVGKTRLLEAAGAIARRASLSVSWACPSELERDLGWGVVRDLFEARLQRLSSPARETVLTGAARLALPVLGASGAVALPAGADGLAAALHGLYWLTANLAELGGLVFLVDDAHWADEPSGRWLAYMAARVAELPVALVVAARPAEPGGTHGIIEALSRGAAGATVLRPSPLSEQATTTLVREMLGARAESRFCEACFRATRGNPFMIAELLGELGRAGVLPLDINVTRVEMVGPVALGSAALGRVARLGNHAVRLLDAVAVLGSRVPLGAAAALAGLTEEAAARTADELADAGLLSGGLPLEFVHPLLRAAIYGRQPRAQVALRHREAARLLTEQGADDEAIALHLLAVEPAGDANVVDCLRRAGEDLLTRGAPGVAANYLRRALREPPTEEEGAALTYRLGQAEVATAGPGGLDTLERAVEVCRDPDQRAAIALEFSRSARMCAEYPRATRVLYAVAETLVPGTPLATRIDGELINVAMLDRATVATAFRRLAQYRDASVADTLQDPGVLADLAVIANATAQPREVAIAYARRAIAAMGTGEPDPSVVLYVACALMYSEQYDEARELWDALIGHARTTGSALAYGFGTCFRAQISYRVGAIHEAEEDARKSVEIYADWPSRTVQPQCVLCDALIERGSLAEANQLLEPTPAHLLPGLWDVSQLLYSRGRLRLAQNRPADAIEDLRACGERLGRNPSLAPWRSDAALALARLDRREEGMPLVREEIAIAREFGAPRSLGVALRAAGLIETGLEGLALLEEAVHVLAESQAQAEHARALCDFGAALRRAGRRGEAREPLRQALELASAAGASQLADRARGELITAGARPRRDRIVGRDALTASERRVATMAAEGSTNPEIAQALFVTKRTVETHLTHIYRKLDITSRAELAHALANAVPG